MINNENESFADPKIKEFVNSLVSTFVDEGFNNAKFNDGIIRVVPRIKVFGSANNLVVDNDFDVPEDRDIFEKFCAEHNITVEFTGGTGRYIVNISNLKLK